MNILLLENIHDNAIETLERDERSVRALRPALGEDELIAALDGVDVLGIRSKTNVTRSVVEAAPRLMAIGAFCIGTNQVDLAACAEHGIPVFNAPYANTRSVVELALGEMIMLLRGVTDKSVRLHAGIWDKSAANAREVRGKRLGIIGYGNIGTQLSVLAEALGMEVHFYDVRDRLAIGSARRSNSLDALLGVADIITVHVDGRGSNENLIGERELALMKPGSFLLNLSRGHVVDIAALVAALGSGHIAGAAVDVFPSEPKGNDEIFENALCGMPNVILTPHVGGSTEEAQANIGTYVAGKLEAFITRGDTDGAVNFPELQLPTLEGAHRLAHAHANVPGVLSNINRVLADGGANIVGQYLKTRDAIGYVITDIAQESTLEMQRELRDIPGTIRLRVLY